MTFAPQDVANEPGLSIRARIIVEGALAGIHRSSMRGSSIEFEQHKEYSRGDDLRHLDWKVYARADRYYVKQFEQESDLTAQLVLDATGSMRYRGSGTSKLDYAAHILASLAHILIHQRDRVGLRVFGGKSGNQHIPARARPTHLNAIFRSLESTCLAGGSGSDPLGPALSDAGERMSKRRGLIVVATDFFEEAPTAVEILRWLRARGHDVVVFHILDRDEIDFSFEGMTRFTSLEGEAELVTNPRTIRRDYLRRLKQFLEEIDQRLTSGGVEYHLAPTDQGLEELIRRFILRRIRGRTQ